ncbi:unnamed protein product [marine sediment metagenome]|uniref:Uncharacterized protein n=1 Tax=marine sediment metagenome TaxID=412755 RepID=X0TEH5_9ZZZZ
MLALRPECTGTVARTYADRNYWVIQAIPSVFDAGHVLILLMGLYGTATRIAIRSLFTDETRDMIEDELNVRRGPDGYRYVIGSYERHVGKDTAKVHIGKSCAELSIPVELSVLSS